MKVITVISYPRTGSSLLIHLARSLPVCALLEIFHPNEVIAKEQLVSGPHGDKFADIASHYSRSSIILNVFDFLESLKRSCPSDILLFKVFPGHLPSTALEGLISESSAILIHTRNRLHSFISNSIATQLKKWGGVDTSDKLISFNKEGFCEYLSITQEFLASSVGYAVDHNKPILFSSFEKLRAFENPEIQLQHVADVISHVTGREILPITNSRDLPQKQDVRSYASDKVINSTELIDFLTLNMAEELNANTRDIPFSGYQRILKGSKG